MTGTNKLFAQYGTTKKVLAFIGMEKGDVLAMQQRLEESFGGRWLLVDNLKENEIICFTDGKEYRGFEPGTARYSDAIRKL